MPVLVRPTDTCYLLGRHGFIYCSHRASEGYTTRPLGVILLSVEEAAFTVQCEHMPEMMAAGMAVAPLVRRRLMIGESPVLRFNVSPGHPTYQALTGLRNIGVLPLNRSAYGRLNPDFERLCDGTATLDDAERIFQRVVGCTSQKLPPGLTMTSQAKEMTQIIDEHPSISTEGLCAHFEKSSDWLTRCFRNAVGMSIRDYKEYSRGMRLVELLHTDQSLTDIALEAGFRDSSQLSHAFHRWFGCSPSYLRNPKHVKVLRHPSRFSVA